MAEDRLAAIAYEEAKRSLDKQEADLESLKTRATAILSVAAVVAGLLGPKLIEQHKLGAWGWLAVVTFVVTGAIVVFILWPHGWKFAQDIETLLNRAEKVKELDPEKVGRDIQLSRARNLRDYRIENETYLSWLTKAYTLSCALLVVQVIAWIVRGVT